MEDDSSIRHGLKKVVHCPKRGAFRNLARQQGKVDTAQKCPARRNRNRWVRRGRGFGQAGEYPTFGGPLKSAVFPDPEREEIIASPGW